MSAIVVAKVPVAPTVATEAEPEMREIIPSGELVTSKDELREIMGVGFRPWVRD